MTAKRRFRGSAIGESLVAMPYSVLQSTSFLCLSANSVKLLLDLAANTAETTEETSLLRGRSCGFAVGEAKTRSTRRSRSCSLASFVYQARKGDVRTCAAFTR
jgi:hypothetical protein